MREFCIQDCEDKISAEAYWFDPFECTHDKTERNTKHAKEFQIRIKRNCHLQELLLGFYGDYRFDPMIDYETIYFSEYIE